MASTVLATVLGSVAMAAPATANPGPPGDNGTVKVHDSETPADEPRNEPHVCDFYLAGFQFDPGQEVEWEIKSWPPTGDREQVLEGELTLDDDGHGRTEDLELEDGHYRLIWNFDGQRGAGKHKTFWVDCDGDGDNVPPDEDDDGDDFTPPDEDDETTPPDDEEAPPEDDEDESTPPDEDDGTDDDEPADEKPEAGAEDTDEAAAEDTADEGSLPVTGAELGALIAAALVALGGGAALWYFTRKRPTEQPGSSEG